MFLDGNTWYRIPHHFSNQNENLIQLKDERTTEVIN